MNKPFLGMNDSSPFNCAELKQDEPGVFELFHEIGGDSLPLRIDNEVSRVYKFVVIMQG
jgi:hypothetical protein